ncbi:hypothetical protein MUK70_28970 [Dyadobacter chenwenxiniae]|uniref:Uncharacterized protein n=1 Tax=Dyadobacter chenwenxiniae TaxID=2906456 RepID=A0A9X1TG09_9BACT|nr:hypothetical protein [Dyadobacter chenwenxiniae]MCF0050045.1 hypothetical protein [Dyadobacter chenwenxiniae]MCF0064916.1 hypothetical protein [Dyadobacter chenwenxiniae]UON83038.1 hypothetical protein MUK70_28970 [Dyadobacter chenwenxiniae]
MEKQNKSRSVFIVVTILFIALFAYISYDMSSRTTAPWNKPKQLNRALPGATPDADSLLLDSLLEEVK